MKIIKARNYDELSKRAAGYIEAQVLQKPDSVLGLATGSSPIGAYQALIKAYNQGYMDFSEVTSINLDEYVGLAPDNDQSYRYFMHTNLFDHINIDQSKTHVPDGLAADGEAECARYEALIAANGGIDLQLLGLGLNGHIGFNEPADHFPVYTNRVDLTESTIQANKRFFAKEEDMPRQAYTMGIGTIMKARRVVLIAAGEAKAEIVRQVVAGPVQPQVPASVLQLHPNAILIGDEGSLSKL